MPGSSGMTGASETGSCRGEPVYPTIEQVLAVYADVMGIPPEDARHYVRDWNTLESTLQRPRQAAYYAGADLVMQAAHLLWGMVQNHPFHDGNKRTANDVTQAFLEVNGWAVAADEDELFCMLITVARGELTTAQVAVWIEERLEVCDPE